MEPTDVSPSCTISPSTRCPSFANRSFMSIVIAARPMTDSPVLETKTLLSSNGFAIAAASSLFMASSHSAFARSIARRASLGTLALASRLRASAHMSDPIVSPAGMTIARIATKSAFLVCSISEQLCTSGAQLSHTFGRSQTDLDGTSHGRLAADEAQDPPEPQREERSSRTSDEGTSPLAGQRTGYPSASADPRRAASPFQFRYYS